MRINILILRHLKNFAFLDHTQLRLYQYREVLLSALLNNVIFESQNSKFVYTGCLKRVCRLR